MKKWLLALLLVLVLCEFVVGVAYSEVDTSFVVMGSGDVGDSDFFGEYGDYLVAGVLVLIVVVLYSKSIRGSGKKGK